MRITKEKLVNSMAARIRDCEHFIRLGRDRDNDFMRNCSQAKRDQLIDITIEFGIHDETWKRHKEMENEKRGDKKL